MRIPGLWGHQEGYLVQVSFGMPLSRKKILTEELSATSLDSTGVPCRSIRISFIAIFLGDFTIFLRITVDNYADHSKFLCTLHLQPTEDPTVLGDGNLPLQGDVGIYEVLEVLVRAKVDIHKLCGHIASSRIAMEHWDPVWQAGSRILFEDILLQCSFKGHFSLITGRLQEGQAVIERVVDVNVISREAGILHTEFLPFFQSPECLGQILSTQVWSCGIVLAPLSGLICGRYIEEDLLELVVRQTVALRPCFVGDWVSPGEIGPNRSTLPR